MDNKKDKTEIQNNPSVEVFLGQDSLSVFLFKKTERLVGALFLVGKILPENDPLSATLKRLGLNLLSLISRTAASKTGWGGTVRQEVKETLVEIVSVLGVSHLAGFVSTMNYDIIVREINNTLEILTTESNFSGISLPKNLFDVGEFMSREGQNQVEKNVVQDAPHKGHIRHLSFKKATDTNKVKIDNKEKRHDRKHTIIDVFKKQGGELMIKDLAMHVKDCSEKTIQRELVSLVSQGVLKKEGERRWSRYSLVSTV